ncbi:MAG: acetyl-CoA/propionyl-CoA carboxylase, biotin carboxylase, biotin carboxyl carrier protein, partial [Thermoleophilaceae bacterium]|nr:acetyl-CoA/propionyl-CoA carboxylase, biotin carboxylase, biotin carboxyl carrier protein [Thermoleophilaceae bacterium]
KEEFHFIEINTRLQVEHPVTELVTGIDIVQMQIRIAAGEKLAYSQDDVVLRGHAIECRINAESAPKNFAPAPGTLTHYREPSGPGVRVDSGVATGSEITPLYDPMVAKLIVWDVDRESATRRMIRALGEFELEGVRSLIPFHIGLLATEQWQNGETCRDLIEDKDWLKQFAQPKPGAGGDDEEPQVERSYAVEVSGRRFDVKVIGAAPSGDGAGSAAVAGAAKSAPRRRERGGNTAGAAGEILSPLQGTVLRVAVEKGAEVEAGALVCVIEAMKMENEITAPAAGKVEELNVTEGASVGSGDTIAVIK